MAEYQISSCAYVKMLLHAAKYPHNAVNGVLLAEKEREGKNWNVVDAIPLFHISLYLSPMAEIALVHVDELAAKRNLKVGKSSFHHVDKFYQFSFPEGCRILLRPRESEQQGTRRSSRHSGR